MKRRELCFVISCFFSITLINLAYAQNQQRIDSLQLELAHYQQKNTLDDSLIVNTTYQLSRNYWHSNPDKALTYAKKSLDVANSLSFTKGIGNAYHSMGVIHVIQGDFKEALQNLKKSLKLREQIKDQHGIAASYNLMGYIYAAQSNETKALENYQKALLLFEELNEELYAGTVNSEIGNIYTKKNEYATALAYNQKALKTFEKLQHQGGVANVLDNIGKLNAKKGNYSESLQNHKDALQLHIKTNNKLGVIESQIHIGLNLLHLNNYTKAIKNCSIALKEAKKLNAISDQKEACKCLYKANKKLNDPLKALFYHEKYIRLNDSLDKGATSKKLQQMEFQKQVFVDSLKQEEEKLVVKLAHVKEVQKKENQRNLFFGIGALVLLLAISLLYRLRYVRKSKATLQVEKDRSENLLLNILPSEIATELKENGKATAKSFNNVAILFTDFENFTQKAEKMSATSLVEELNSCFKAFDKIMDKYHVEKIKTIGDAYMAVGGLPIPSNNALKKTIMAALEMQSFISDRKKEQAHLGKPYFEMRIGIHTGSVAAGIVGIKKFQYDIWGDAVNTAARVESTGATGKVNISRATFDRIKNDADFVFEDRGKIKVKGKGEMKMYFVRLSY